MIFGSAELSKLRRLQYLKYHCLLVMIELFYCQKNSMYVLNAFA